VLALGIAVPASLATSATAHAATGFIATQDLDGRDGPSLDANTVAVDKYRAGGTVQMVCQAGGNRLWLNRLGLDHKQPVGHRRLCQNRL
jgi:hypothetical protein